MTKYYFLLALLFITYTGFSQQINEEKLLMHLKAMSADSMEGRGYGTAGGEKAIRYIEENFKVLDIQPAFPDGFTQEFTSTRNEKMQSGKNVVGIIPGFSDKIIVITAHFDHLGIKDGQIYNGADDNASGTAALFSIAKYFLAHKPDHTLVIAAVDAEEVGSIGAQYLLENFPLDSSKIALNVNLDMIAHNDKNELYACGTYHYPQLKAPLQKVKGAIDLKFGHDTPSDIKGNNWTYSSDHRVFHRKGIPFIYFGVEDHKDYHKPTDTFDKINQEFYINAVDFIIKAIDQLDSTISN
ncbi:MAG: M20/M25/M40 family metallo-hydrolase [Candidatus Cyclobacteriaceae bacterium M2_1C_046]